MTKKVTLLAITGLAPQVVTETLYGIYTEGLDWPTHIEIITTELGSEQARLSLIVDKQIQQLCSDYKLPLPHFDVQDIYVVPDAHGQYVNDARTIDDQEALADFITQRVALLSQDPNTWIHASIAGGRKTMTFFLGYAMTIFARPQDRISHVLVSEAYESASDFFYPTPYSKSIKSRAGQMLDASKAVVTLAEIPFVSQRTLLNNTLLREFDNFGYSGLIQQIQLGLNKDSNTISFIFDAEQPVVKINETPVCFAGNKMEFAFMAMCYRPRDTENAEEDRVERPKDASGEAIVTKYFLTELCHLAQLEYGRLSEQELLNILIDLDILKGKTAESLLQDGQIRVTASFFDTRRTNLKAHLLKYFPKTLTDLILPAITYNRDGERLKRGAKNEQLGFYGTWLDPHQIHFSRS